MKQENAKLKRDLKRDGEAIKGLLNNIHKWREAYASMRDTKNDAEMQAVYQYKERVRLENTKNETIDQMTQQIFQLRSDIEEVKITEDDLLNEYETLISSIRECVGMLGYYLGLSDEWSANEQTVRSRLGFDSPALSQHTLHEYRLPADMLRLLVEGTEKHLYQSLTRWPDFSRDKAAPLGVFGTVLSEFEADVINLMEESKFSGKSPAGKAMGKQKSNVASKTFSVLTPRNE